MLVRFLDCVAKANKGNSKQRTFVTTLQCLESWLRTNNLPASRKAEVPFTTSYLNVNGTNRFT